MTLSVVTYAWQEPNGKHNDKYIYGLDDARILQAMFEKHLTVPHEFVCITNRTDLFANEPKIRAVELDMTTHIPGRCYCRLMTFSPQAKHLFGERILQVDIDMLIVRNMDSIVERDEDMVLWRNPRRVPYNQPGGPCWYNLSMFLYKTGTLEHFYTDFDPDVTPKQAKDDQWLISDALGPDMPYWDGERDGVYRLAIPYVPGSGVDGDLPENAKIVFTPGDQRKAWQAEIQERNSWIKSCYPYTGRDGERLHASELKE
jgi:hypothetical protein